MDDYNGVASTPAPGRPWSQKKCKSIDVRKEWRTLSIHQRRDYIRAVKCLAKKPSNAGPGRLAMKTRFDQFVAAHFDLNLNVHAVGQFLPWHRHFVTLYTNALRDECGYRGPTPYWDWTRDADAPEPFVNSPVFDTVLGFGGDGVFGTADPLPPMDTPFPPLPGFPTGPKAPEGCLQSGPFKDFKVRFGPLPDEESPTGMCIVRGIFEGVRNNVNSTSLAATLAQPTFEDFRNFIELQAAPLEEAAGIHWAGHAIVGGTMMNGYGAPADPIFYLHHANLDRIWTKWQNADRQNRLYEISGPISVVPETDVQVTLDWILPFETVADPIPLRDVMDTEAYPSCFRYDDQ
ncbi:tyrosinase central domain-containing protein [Coprinopsis cinerea okayama7|uniref:Tyrosinase central domain-containing protein n=1 Tax=Coprinopsis cinerea (strain Okayama-7 / 130 / ATCC MYA-4618 / FGSC 9003) TaxID=240176 RepID=A8MZV5_COPC7|nr:tyrosinase central domain-containing protein [Coprinopsis cinerea okayama7\|eukprot:XP_001828177.2 tyrosinase central domain-containing protein [Coprinopsis cinerea okayama7\